MSYNLVNNFSSMNSLASYVMSISVAVVDAVIVAVEAVVVTAVKVVVYTVTAATLVRR